MTGPVNPAPSAALASVSDLTIGFQREDGIVRAVNGVSFELAAGEVLTIIGESGSGKSVLLRSLLGITAPRALVSGSVRICGRDLACMATPELQRIRGRVVSMVFQEPMTALDPVFTIGAQIAEMIVRHEGASHAGAWKRAQELLELVAVPSASRRLGNYPHEMSGGMRQRAMIALALACRPSLLLADEPTTALDATVQMQLLLLIRQLQRDLGMAVVFVTHDMAVAAEISDRVAVMYAGRFMEIGSVEDVLLSPKHPYAAGLLRSTIHAGMRGTKLDGIAGMPPDLRELPPGCSFAARCAFADDGCCHVVPTPTDFGGGHFVSCLRVAP